MATPVSAIRNLGPAMEAAFARLWQIRTLKGVIVGFSAMGFGIFTAPFLENIFLEDEFDLEALDRGIAKTAGGIFVMIALLWIGSGVIGGCGLGLGYISPVSTLIKWFPDKRGMATGMAIISM